MKQYKVTSYDINQNSPDDCYLAPEDPIHELKALAGLGGLGGQARLEEYRAKQIGSYGQEMSAIGTEKSQTMRSQNIQPGTPEWFKLWFSLPKLNGGGK